MSESRSASDNESSPDLFDLWMAPRSPAPDDPTVRPGTRPQTVEDFPELAHPAPALGGTAGAPPSLGPETERQVEPPSTPAPSPVTNGASATFPLGLVLFPAPQRTHRVVTVVIMTSALGALVAVVVAWLAPGTLSLVVAAALLAVLLLAWQVRARIGSSQVTIENGLLRVVQGRSKHLFPLVSEHPPIEVVGEPGQRDWKVLIHRRGLPPFVITDAMVEPARFTEVLRQFRPQA